VTRRPTPPRQGTLRANCRADQRPHHAEESRSSKTISEVARELELNSETLRGWVKKYQKQQEPTPDAELTVNERARLKELERRNRELEMEVTFLKKAAAYFAKDPR
ncbi:transposase, partial [Streptomyces sp. NPDC005480]|uniref:transposase n=1 Tax=Streptomyces sp. NPDC005480 TaxID=3154880 RepID=UPI0033BD43BE